MKDKKRLGNEKNVLHQGDEGQKAAKKCEIVLHQIEGQKTTEKKGGSNEKSLIVIWMWCTRFYEEASVKRS